MQHDYNDLIRIFNETFLENLNTELKLGGDEPVYLPASDEYPHHQIIFARGYFASAMHELAHWCIAGYERRLLEDYGYWYEPDGRTEQVQAKFEAVEVKPQAIEWILSASCGFQFQVSCDNLSSDCEPNRLGFTLQVKDQVLLYLESGIPRRAQILSDLFCEYYQIESFVINQFSAPDVIHAY